MLVCVRDVRLVDLVTETGDDPFEQLEFLVEAITEAHNVAERRECLRRRARNGDMNALSQLLASDSRSLTEEEIVDCYGQQMNFQSSKVYGSSELVFEEVAI